VVVRRSRGSRKKQTQNAGGSSNRSYHSKRSKTSTSYEALPTGSRIYGMRVRFEKVYHNKKSAEKFAAKVKGEIKEFDSGSSGRMYVVHWVETGHPEIKRR